MSTVFPLIIIVIVGLAAFVVGAVIAHRQGYKKLGEVVVRCRRGHFFTTEWAARGAMRGLDLGWARIQRCPVGGHLTVVVPVDDSDLTAEQKKQAREHRDDRPGRRGP